MLIYIYVNGIHCIDLIWILKKWSLIFYIAIHLYSDIEFVAVLPFHDFNTLSVSFQAQLDILQSEIASAAKKTGIASAAKLATITPKKQLVRFTVKPALTVTSV